METTKAPKDGSEEKQEERTMYKLLENGISPKCKLRLGATNPRPHLKKKI